MAGKSKKTAAPEEREPDRVAMVSVRADGTPDHESFVIIGDDDSE